MSLYRPPAFRHEDPARVRELLARHPMATLISSGNGEPVLSHLPLVIDPAAPLFTVDGHLARPNPHGQLLAASPSALAIIHGPDAYVSPSWYESRESVPTWNYMVVHLKLQVTMIDTPEQKEAILKRLIDAFDPAYAAQWDGLDRAYRDRMLGGIVGLRAEVTGWDAKFKLSQNRPPADRARVTDALSAGDARARDLAQWMRTLGIAG